MPTHLSATLGVRCWVTVGEVGEEQPLELYKTKVKPTKLSAYIEAQTDTEFTFVGKRETSTTIRSYKFANVQLTDDEAIAVGEERIIKALGTIQVKAVLSHSTALGAPKFAAPLVPVSVAWLDSIDQPLLSFEFIYRSRTLLELNGIVPAEEVKADPTPPPVAGPSSAPKRKRAPKGTPESITLDSDDSDADDKEVEDPLAELARLRAELAKDKGIKKDPDPSPVKKKIKKELETLVIEDDDD
ncbi:hypothetical protein RQP46_005463 [Phenoliferia psychrophenolica]